MAFYSFRGIVPKIQPESYVHPQASIIGDVIIGKNVYVGPFASLRGDFGRIVIHDGCNIQDSCTIHMFPGVTVVLEEMAHVGHGAIVHGARIGKNVLIGMHAVIMDDVEIGEDSVIGALTFVPTGMKIPPNSLVAGNPAKIIKEVKKEMTEWKTKGTLLYQKLANECLKSLYSCEPHFIENIKDAEKIPQEMWIEEEYRNWKKTEIK